MGNAKAFNINFFTREHTRIKQVLEEVREIQSSDSETNNTFNRLMDSVKEYGNQYNYVLNHEKESRFNMLTDDAVIFAEDNNFNISIKLRGHVGIIELVNDKICFEDFLNEKSKEIFLELNKEANSVWYGIDKIDVSGEPVDVMKIRFGYDLYDKVRI